MTQNARNLTTLYGLLADNITGDISPEDVRDLVETLRSEYGLIYISAKAETAIALTATYYKVLGTTLLDTLARNFDMPASNRLRYIGLVDRVVKVSCCFSVSSVGNNKLFGFKLAKNGTVIDHSITQRKVAAGADVGAAAICAHMLLDENDYVELFVANETDDTNVTVETMTMYAEALAHPFVL